MSPLKFIADVNISPQTVSTLKEADYDIIRSSEILPANAKDIEILELARSQNRIIVTQDLDFSMLVAINGYDQPSLITLRLSSAKPSIVTQRLLDVFPIIESEFLEAFAMTIDDEAIRIRKLPIT